MGGWLKLSLNYDNSNLSHKTELDPNHLLGRRNKVVLMLPRVSGLRINRRDWESLIECINLIIQINQEDQVVMIVDQLDQYFGLARTSLYSKQ